ncbi:sigma-70 family RNA polymerase sigma factor [Sphingomonas sp.]|uniref:sigma-70 family RNA polymerase sigma factor n=1 Tax=Sphingomonas sp. TaxID=28214 RepID=UPI0025D1603F|nr:RNA polymerase sigma factor FliA [Sphingomonas sp.]
MALVDTPVAALTYGTESRVDPEQLIREHMGLVRKIAWHVHGRVSTAIDVEDLIQSGMIALIEAARGYQDRGHAFATYASLRIRGSMIDGLRKQATQCRSAMAKRRAIAGARDQFERANGRPPGDTELADAMGVDLPTYHAMADAAQSVRHESIDDLYSDHSMWFADVEERADDAIERTQLQAAIARGIGGLPEREAMVLQLYFVEELNLDEIGETLGVGAARVCQIKKAALNKLRFVLDRD